MRFLMLALLGMALAAGADALFSRFLIRFIPVGRMR